ncbi:MAG: glucose-6-phosphate isomerase, partial [Candidatus Hydrogenedentes bacterium]|nr:glucose-6-phosphate isomerase [Candidatus Hydrogenedentota bacterium]
MTLDIALDISRAKASAVGIEHGITPHELESLQPRVTDAHAALQQEREQGLYGFWDLYKDTETLDRVKQAAQTFRARDFENLVILGIGGSALGTTALVTALKGKFYNLLTRRQR